MNSIKLLEHEKQIFTDLQADDGLLVTAKGLGIERILLQFLSLYCEPSFLVLVLNTNAEEEEYFVDELKLANVTQLPKSITNESGALERESIYLQGGTLFVTSRILVVDMLTKRLPIHLVTGILVYRAHKIGESGQEAFILRLYRQENKTGFIKAFSDSPNTFITGFCQVEKVMKNLFVRKLFLWPRFHATVGAFLEKHKPDVVELHVELTPSMLAIQMSILDLMGSCLKELRKGNPSLDPDELTVENCITRSFDRSLRMQLDPLWHQLSGKTKQLVSELKVLRTLMVYLTQYDCVTFYNILESIRMSERNSTNPSLWLFMDAANSLFINARERVFGSAKKSRNGKPGNKRKSADDIASVTSYLSENEAENLQNGDVHLAQIPDFEMEYLEPFGALSSEEDTETVGGLEECPKWKVLKEIMKEIENENEPSKGASEPGRILITANDERTCAQLREFFCQGGTPLLKRLFERMFGSKEEEAAKKEGNSKSKTSKSKRRLKQPEVKCSEVDEDLQLQVLPNPLTVIHPLHGSSDSHSLLRTLYEIEPRYVILYDPEMEFVRQLEVFKASRPGVQLRVYFIIYTGSVEEQVGANDFVFSRWQQQQQINLSGHVRRNKTALWLLGKLMQRYLTTLRKEKEAFEMLIKQKATMVIPEEREGKTEASLQLLRDSSKATDAVSSRKAGGRKKEEKATGKIIVDMREFRSELPSLIHRRGIDIEPVTLEVGDYILTPEICVERKSVSDLIGSLNSGRLYNQALAMTRFYPKPILLIEFDQNKSFSLQAKSSLTNEISIQHTSSKLTLLTIHFPKLKIIWTQSPYATAELFEELKANYPEPDVETAVAIGLHTEGITTNLKYSVGPQDFVRKLPGINSKNYKLHDEYWAVNLESLGLDTLSNTETSKPCVISKHGLVVHKFNGEVTKSRPKGDDDDIEISMV